MDTAETLRRVRALELRTRGVVESLFAGEHASSFVGRGFEFSHVRPYHPGDDVRAIDWKVTARRDAPYVREFVEERDLLVVLVVDVSASGRFGAGRRSAREVASEISAALAFAAARLNDRVALLLVSDRVETHVPPGSGRRHVLRLLTRLLEHRPRGVGTDLTPALERVGRWRLSRAAVFLVSDFVRPGPEEALRPALSRVGRSHDLVAVRLGGPTVGQLPDVGWAELTDPESGRRVVVDTGSRRLRNAFGSRVRRARAAAAAWLGDAGAELIEVDVTGDPLEPLAAFFRRRRRAGR